MIQHILDRATLMAAGGAILNRLNDPAIAMSWTEVECLWSIYEALEDYLGVRWRH